MSDAGLDGRGLSATAEADADALVAALDVVAARAREGAGDGAAARAADFTRVLAAEVAAKRFFVLDLPAAGAFLEVVFATGTPYSFPTLRRQRSRCPLVTAGELPVRTAERMSRTGY